MKRQAACRMRRQNHPQIKVHTASRPRGSSSAPRRDLSGVQDNVIQARRFHAKQG
jgi:hypothetical protein